MRSPKERIECGINDTISFRRFRRQRIVCHLPVSVVGLHPDLMILDPRLVLGRHIEVRKHC
jgi:hypothetical protein